MSRNTFLNAWAGVLCSLALAGCFDAESVSTSTQPTGSETGAASTPPEESTPVTLPEENHAPVISGAPAASVTIGGSYEFVPQASDADSQTLGFSVQNKPAWLNFNTANGRLWGVPPAGSSGTYGDITVSVSDGEASASLPPFAISVTAATGSGPAPNAAPTITGTPATSVTAGTAYRFQPVASDPEGSTLSFSITGKPAWASFDPITGTLSGTPVSAQAGSYGNIIISVSDGTTSRSLPAFAVTVQQGMGSATISWRAPTLNTDGSALTNLAGYRIYHGMSATSMAQVKEITNPLTLSYTVEALGPGKHYFALRAFNSDGSESELSTVGTKTIL